MRPLSKVEIAITVARLTKKGERRKREKGSWFAELVEGIGNQIDEKRREKKERKRKLVCRISRRHWKSNRRKKEREEREKREVG